MKLGKALATGVAEERPDIHDEEETVRRPAEAARTAPAEPAREEVPAGR
ncbi:MULTISPECIES: hypothetical protein [unclassified Streptomyces]|nr:MULTISPECIES: hypothetical protein [Streptomyces]RAJ51431.1 hypothetical protein K376_06118 [Streptomyces sp. PsTaAH-130]